MTMQVNEALFAETTHSPSLVDLVGFEAAKAVIDFCFIANPYYPTVEMIEELATQLPHLIKAYPSSNPRVSAGHLAQVLHVDPAHLIIGNGATELITEICHDLVPSIGVPIPTFGEYLEKIEPARLRLYPLDRDDNYRLHLDQYGAWTRAEQLRAALVINPHNPTGQLFSVAEMEAFLQQATDLDLVIVDESFIDFAAEEVPTLLPVAATYDNLVIVRSMSKHCGVPGLRLGYAYTGNRALVSRLRNALPTWNINTPADYYLSMLPRTDAEYHASRRRVIQDVRLLYRELCTIDGITVYPTGANFVCFRVDNGLTARQLQRQLLVEHQMYVRDCSNKEGMDQYHIRVASQGRANDLALVAALREMMTG
ncbi:MAG: histidinol-phosphate aminotransferase family protein [Caldilineaceae bacterium]|nr:histidinol-phosphate aminotransferase family protein [Caldilineaceae bacterium]